MDFIIAYRNSDRIVNNSKFTHKFQIQWPFLFNAGKLQNIIYVFLLVNPYIRVLQTFLGAKSYFVGTDSCEGLPAWAPRSSRVTELHGLLLKSFRYK